MIHWSHKKFSEYEAEAWETESIRSGHSQRGQCDPSSLDAFWISSKLCPCLSMWKLLRRHQSNIQYWFWQGGVLTLMMLPYVPESFHTAESTQPLFGEDWMDGRRDLLQIPNIFHYHGFDNKIQGMAPTRVLKLHYSGTKSTIIKMIAQWSTTQPHIIIKKSFYFQANFHSGRHKQPSIHLRNDHKTNIAQ